jgi:hypothetical protein
MNAAASACIRWSIVAVILRSDTQSTRDCVTGLAHIGRHRKVGFAMRTEAKQTPWTDVKIAVSIPVASMSLVMVDDTIRHVLHILER